MKNNSQKMDYDIGIITASLNKFFLEGNNASFVLNKHILTCKIIDKCKVSESQAKRYLDIIQSRSKIIVEHNTIRYVPQREEIKTKEDINKDFEEAFEGEIVR